MASSIARKRAFSEWFWTLSDKLGKGSFVHYLHLRPTPQLEETTSPNTFIVKFKIPESLCTKHEKFSKPIFTLSSILAIFDEISTDAFVLSDKNKRPGVSITLTGEYIHETCAGEMVEIKTTVNKIGKTIGFVDIEMLSEQNSSSSQKVLARGSHVKFLPMPFMWNILFGRLFFLTKPIINFVLSIRNPPELKINPDAPIHDIFEFKEKAESINNTIATEKEQSRASIEFSVKTDLCNPMGSLHGGACCIASEEAASRSIRNLHGLKDPLIAKFMHVTFLTGVQKGKIVADAVTENNNGVSSFVQLSKNGKQLNTARIIWKY